MLGAFNSHGQRHFAALFLQGSGLKLSRENTPTTLKSAFSGVPATGVPSHFHRWRTIERPNRLIRHQFGRIHQQRQGVAVFTVRTTW